MNQELQMKFAEACRVPSDINEHVDTLYNLALDKHTVVEMGTRSGVSTIGLLSAQPKKLICIDNAHFPHVKEELLKVKGDTDLEFIDADTLEVEIPECDVLFIDTLHTYEQLTKELARHAGQVKKCIAFHDTVTFGRTGEHGGEKGLMHAVEDFLANTKGWEIHSHHTNNNGLLIIWRRKHPRSGKYC